MAKSKAKPDVDEELENGAEVEPVSDPSEVKEYAVRRKVKHNGKLYIPSGKATKPTTIQLSGSEAAPLLTAGAIRE